MSQEDADNAELWSRWSHEHGGAVFGYLLAMVRRHDLAEDLVQEVFVRAWQARDRYEERGTARAYLFRIADRLVVDRSRRQMREMQIGEQAWQLVEPAGTQAAPDDPLEREEARREMLALLDGLSAMQQRVLLMRYYGELTFAEIAAILECPINTALSHCQRGLAALRKTLAETSK